MTTYVKYSPEGRVIDLASLCAADYELIASLHCNIRAGDGTLICLQPTAGNGEMRIFQRNGRYWAAHFAGGAHGSHMVALESDDHKRQKEYWLRAAEDAGYRAENEVRSGNGTILDVAIDGPVRTGIEIQHSPIRLPLLRARTTKSFRAGYLTVWFTDAGTAVPWLHKVPSLGCNRLPWHETLPARRAATATGLRRIESVRCVIGAFDRCPEGRYRPCGRYHMKVVPWAQLTAVDVQSLGYSGRAGGLTVDDVAAMLPAGQIVPLQGRNGSVYLVPPSSAERYRELSGCTGLYDPGGKPQPLRPSRTPKLCASPAHQDLPQNPSPHPLGEWARCRGCQRRYRPATTLHLCYDCRMPGAT